MVLWIHLLLVLVGLGFVLGRENYTVFPTNDKCQEDYLDVCTADIGTQRKCLCSGNLSKHIWCRFHLYCSKFHVTTYLFYMRLFYYEMIARSSTLANFTKYVDALDTMYNVFIVITLKTIMCTFKIGWN